jgi:putative transposase
MRRPRFKAPVTHKIAFYHCISRVVDRQLLFGADEKNQFLFFMREYARFCGLQIVTYCIMSNHFHILVGVPAKPERPLSDEQLLTRLESLSGLTNASTIRQRLETHRKYGHHKAAEALRDTILCRMWDVSAFMKLLKQRFGAWYNRRHSRKGTLWEERFKSVLVESAGPTLATMAAYIDLNPIRANLINNPEEYRWCGYAAAVAGDPIARQGYGTLFDGYAKPGNDVMAIYRKWLFGQGEQTEGTTETGATLRRGFERERVVEVMEQNGRLPLGDYLRCRVRYFADGLVFGTREYVDDVFRSTRDYFSPGRKHGARRMAGIDRPFYSMRALRSSVVT